MKSRPPPARPAAPKGSGVRAGSRLARYAASRDSTVTPSGPGRAPTPRGGAPPPWPAAAPVEQRAVRPLDEVAEEPRELLALARRPLAPVAAEDPPGDLGEVEGLFGDPTQREPPLLDPGVALQRGILQDLERRVDGAP